MGRIEISNKFTYHNEYFKESARAKLYLPYIDIVVEDFQPKKPVLIDTGASMSILGLEFEDFFSTRKSVDTFQVQYGGSSKSIKLDVYDIIFTIKGYNLNSRVIFDPAQQYHLLGHIDFFQKHFDVLLFEINRNNLSENKFKLIRKQ